MANCIVTNTKEIYIYILLLFNFETFLHRNRVTWPLRMWHAMHEARPGWSRQPLQSVLFDAERSRDLSMSNWTAHFALWKLRSEATRIHLLSLWFWSKTTFCVHLSLVIEKDPMKTEFPCDVWIYFLKHFYMGNAGSGLSVLLLRYIFHKVAINIRQLVTYSHSGYFDEQCHYLNFLPDWDVIDGY